MNIMNFGVVTGRLVRDVEIREANGRKYAFVNIAVQRNYKNKETGEYDADFLSFVANESRAEFIGKYFKKGDVITLTYALHSSTKKNEEGKNITTVSMNITDAQFVPGAKKANNSSAEKADEKPADTSDFAEVSDDDDDLPF